jgi:uncharacterized protein with von Willebrand factor type A (vWA) domain
MSAPVPSGRLAANVVHFARLLRRAGLPVGVDKALAAVEAAAWVGPERRDDLQAALAATLIDRAEQRELQILRRKAPAAAQALARQVVAFVQRLRTLDLFKSPGIAESIDWCNAIVALDRSELDAPTADATLGALLKYQDDIARVRGAEAARILAELPAMSPA